MALIKCPECGKEVSEQSNICIHCGCPLPKEHFSYIDSGPIATAIPKNNVISKNKLMVGCIVSILIVIAIVVFVVGGQSKEAKAVDDMISSIGEIDLDSEAAISDAEAAYKALEDKDKKQVKLYDTLLALREEFDTLLENSIIGIWEFKKDDVSLRFEFRKNGEFHSYALMFGQQVPGGDGTYTITDNKIQIDMTSGETIEDSEFKITDGVLEMDGLSWTRVS